MEKKFPISYEDAKRAAMQATDAEVKARIAKRLSKSMKNYQLLIDCGARLIDGNELKRTRCSKYGYLA